MKLVVALMLCLLSVAAALAQSASAPEPILRAKIEPPTVVVGQKATLTVDVLAPNYMTKPPVLPDFQLRNAVTRAGSTINMSEQVNGTTYAGVRFEFLIYPQEPGTYAVPQQKVTVTYAAEPPATREATVSVPQLSFEASIPDAAQALDPFVASNRLTVRQEVKRSSEQLKVGDSVIRTVTIEAEGTPSMLLPPLSLGRVTTAEAYPAQPEFQDQSDSRTDALTSRRVEQATYMLQRSGELSLPAIDIGWWNVREQKVEHAKADAVVLQVADNPALRSAPPPPAARTLSPRRLMLALADHWLAVVLVMLAASVLAWFTPRAFGAVRDRLRRRRQAYQQSEAFAFATFRAAARQGDAAKAYFELLNWLARVPPARSLQDFRAAAHDAELDAEITAIEAHLFGAHPTTTETQRSPAKLANCVASARRRLRRMSETAERPSPLPPALNPGQDRAVARQRPVAR